MNTTTTTTLTLLVLCAGAGAAPADTANELELGSWGRGLRTPSANAVTESNLGGAQLGYARQLPLSLMPDLTLWAVGRFAFGTASGTMFTTMETTVDYTEFAAGVRARYRLHDHVRIGARADLGLARTELDISDARHTYSDLGWGPTAGAAAQLELLAVARPGFEFGMRLELGYVASAAVALSPRAADTSEEGTIMLPVGRSSLGHLDLGGPYFGLTFFGQF
ncbi:MAG: outer membrane beta-barrel protein [Deltaproteobacteria bacterium]|nr:outer membrane beta-barrel protein [Deltaproteobacteria bacterium]